MSKQFFKENPLTEEDRNSLRELLPLDKCKDTKQTKKKQITAKLDILNKLSYLTKPIDSKTQNQLCDEIDTMTRVSPRPSFKDAKYVDSYTIQAMKEMCVNTASTQAELAECDKVKVRGGDPEAKSALFARLAALAGIDAMENELVSAPLQNMAFDLGAALPEVAQPALPEFVPEVAPFYEETEPIILPAGPGSQYIVLKSKTNNRKEIEYQDPDIDEEDFDNTQEGAIEKSKKLIRGKGVYTIVSATNPTVEAYLRFYQNRLVAPILPRKMIAEPLPVVQEVASEIAAEVAAEVAEEAKEAKEAAAEAAEEVAEIAAEEEEAVAEEAAIQNMEDDGKEEGIPLPEEIPMPIRPVFEEAAKPAVSEIVPVKVLPKVLPEQRTMIIEAEPIPVQDMFRPGQYMAAERQDELLKQIVKCLSL